MKRAVSAGEARRRLGELLEGVYYRGDEVVIERAGKRMAVVIPTERYEAMLRSRERLAQMITKVQERNQDVPFPQIEREVAAAIAEARAEPPTATR
ncbi:MAG: type II toxin-antitoxin system Phd/YefM family antitoxin [Dehalococcoidia bacterium]